jgi:hypothetical protein
MELKPDLKMASGRLKDGESGMEKLFAFKLINMP